MKNYLKAKFKSTRTKDSQIRLNNNFSKIKSIYCASWSGYEYNTAGYYHEREGGTTYLLCYTQSGHATLSYREKVIDLMPGSLIFINLAEKNVIEAKDSHWEIYFMHVFGSDIDDIYGNATKRTNYFPDYNATIFKECIKNIYDAYGADDIDVYYISGQIYLTLMDVLKNSSNTATSTMVSKAVEYINENYYKDINLDSLCKEIFVSKYFFIRKFQQELKCTPKQYLTRVRLQNARLLLVHTDKSVAEVAQLTGFQTEKNIFYAFRTVLNITPNYFRKHVYTLEEDQPSKQNKKKTTSSKGSK